jgi:lipoic acid synthetase
MAGLGETFDEIVQTLRDLHAAGCEVVTIGQYLQPSAKQLPVRAFITPDVFGSYAEAGRGLGLRVFAGTFVRSSYRAGELLGEEIVSS